MEPTTLPQALGPDLAAIDDLAGRPVHDPDAEGPAAVAIYEDVCWRLALLALPPGLQSDVTRLEALAASLLRRYVSRALPAAEFWSGFRRVVEDLAAIAEAAQARSEDEQEAVKSLRALGARVAQAQLPPTIRPQVQAVLEHMADEVRGYHEGTLTAADFWPLFNEGQGAVEDTIEAAASRAPAPGDMHAVAQRALATDPPHFLRPAIAAQLAALVRAWERHEPLPPSAVSALSGLIERAERFQAEHGAAERRFLALAEAGDQHAFPAAFAEEARDQLRAMARLLAALEAGEIDPEAFHARYEVAAHRLETLAKLAPEQDPLSDANATLRAMQQRLMTATVPRFAALTARDMLAYLGQLVAQRRAETIGEEAFERELQAGLRELEGVLSFGREVEGEKAWALRRFEALERRVEQGALPALLRGPVADLMETLRGLLHRLEAGLYPLAEFHRDFEAEAERLEALLAWQGALGEAEPGAGDFEAAVAALAGAIGRLREAPPRR